MAMFRSEVSLLIVFVDLTQYSAQNQRVSDEELAEVIDCYYAHIAAQAEAAGGRLVKVIGDGALLAFPEDAVDAGVAQLLSMKESIDAFFAERDWPCRANIKAHVGSVVAGDFGGARNKQFDVLGKHVNAAAMLPGGGGVTLSVEAFRKLSPELRRRFKKHSAPITYIRVEDPHRLRRDRPR
jgi:class 3 adenylate cyclase